MKSEIIEFQLALFSPNLGLDLEREKIFIESIAKFLNTSQESIEKQTLPRTEQSNLFPRIFIAFKNIEVQASDTKINFILKRTKQEESFNEENFFKHITDFTNSDFFKECNIKIARVGYAKTYIKKVRAYENFIKKIIDKKLTENSLTFQLNIDYSFALKENEQDSYLRVVSNTAISLDGEKGIAVQFDMSTKESIDLDIPAENTLQKIEELNKSKFVIDKEKFLLED